MKHAMVGDILEGTAVKVYPRYAILLFDRHETGLLHISEVSRNFVHSLPDMIKIGNLYKVKVIAYDEATGAMRVSLKQLTSSERNHTISHDPVPAEECSAEALKEHLASWIQEENAKGGKAR